MKGTVGPGLLQAIDRFVVERTGAESVLVGRDADQADLYGLLVQIQRFGLELVSVSQTDREA